MERKQFLKSLLLGAAAGPALLAACARETVSPSSSSSSSNGSGTTTGSASSGGSCTESPTETEGPYPTHSPGSYVRSDIRDGRAGYDMSLRLTVVNANNSCTPLAGLLVDIWHCDAAGAYSEYGGSGSQATNYTGVHFLRGRQTTDANGQVNFQSIFPGWYTGRATHVHVHVFTAAGVSLKVTQIAFPEGAGSALLAVNGYGKGLSGYTYNAQDGVFGQDYAKLLAAVSGSTSAGFALTQTIGVLG